MEKTLWAVKDGVSERTHSLCRDFALFEWRFSGRKEGAGESGTINLADDTESVLHYFRVMKTRLRNITITLEENVARWARLEAARADTSVSRLLAGILKDHMREKNGYESAMRRALAREAFLQTDGRYLSREETHDRSGLR